MQIGAPDVSMVYANSTSLTSFIAFTGASTFADLANDAERIVYFTPRFGGFQAGISYARDAAQTSGAVNNTTTATTDFIDLGVNYSGTVGGVDLGLSARYGTADRTAGADPDVIGAGLSLGFGNFSFGGGAVVVDNGSGLSKARVFDVGVSYANGPMSYSLTYVEGETAGAALENTIIVAAATYAVSSAFNVGVSLSRVDTDAAGGVVGDIDGTILGLSAQFNF